MGPLCIYFSLVIVFLLWNVSVQQSRVMVNWLKPPPGFKATTARIVKVSVKRSELLPYIGSTCSILYQFSPWRS